METNCGACQYLRKVKHTTYSRCTRYNHILYGQPLQKCAECMEDEKQYVRPREQKEQKKKPVRSKKDDIIEVK